MALTREQLAQRVAQEFQDGYYVNLGIAADTDNGLIVPVMRDVQAKGIMQLAAELAEAYRAIDADREKVETLIAEIAILETIARGRTVYAAEAIQPAND